MNCEEFGFKKDSDNVGWGVRNIVPIFSGVFFCFDVLKQVPIYFSYQGERYNELSNFTYLRIGNRVGKIITELSFLGGLFR